MADPGPSGAGPAQAAAPKAARYCSQRCGIFGRRQADEEHRRRRPRRMGELHLRLVRQPAALAQVAGGTRGDDVLPDRITAARARDDVVERQPPARGAAVDTAPAVTGEEGAPRDLALDDPGNPDVAEKPDHVRPRKPRRGRAEWSVELFDHLRLPLVDEDVRAAQRAHVERLETGVEDQHLLHGARNVADGAAGPLRPLANVPSRARPPAAPRGRAPQRAGRGRSPSCRSGRSRGPGSP